MWPRPPRGAESPKFSADICQAPPLPQQAVQAAVTHHRWGVGRGMESGGTPQAFPGSRHSAKMGAAECINGKLPKEGRVYPWGCRGATNSLTHTCSAQLPGWTGSAGRPVGRPLYSPESQRGLWECPLSQGATGRLETLDKVDDFQWAGFPGTTPQGKAGWVCATASSPRGHSLCLLPKG